MEGLCASSPSPSIDELTKQHKLYFSDSLKDLESLSEQLESAAKYFEISYAEEDQRHMVMDALKDYAINALANTISHLAAASHALEDFLEDQVDVGTPEIDLKVSLIEQRLQSYKEYVDQAGLSQQSLPVKDRKYHKRYILPEGGALPESRKHVMACDGAFRQHKAGSESRMFQDEFQSVLRGKRRSSRKTPSKVPSRRARSSSPSQRPRSLSPSPQQPKVSQQAATNRAASPIPSSNPSVLARSVSVASRNTGFQSVAAAQEDAAEKQKPSSMHKSPSIRKPPSIRVSPSLRRTPSMLKSPSVCLGGAEDELMIDQNQNPGKTKAFLKSLLSRKKNKKDDNIYTYTKEIGTSN